MPRPLSKPQNRKEALAADLRSSSRLIVQLENAVARESTDAMGHRVYYTVPAEHPITIRDLFRHTSGLDYAGPKVENGEIAYRKLGIDGGAPAVPFDLAEFTKRLATAPLNDQPGTMWRY